VSSDLIAIRGLGVDCIVGVYPHERGVPQRVIVDVELSLDTEEAARTERISRTVDYDFVAEQLRFLLENGRFRLLETAAHALARYLLAPPPPGVRQAQIERARLTLTKPDALRGAAVPSLTIERDAAWARPFAREVKPFGTVDVIHETREAGIYRLNLEPGGVIPLHVHRTMREAEMVLGDGVLCQNEPAPMGTVRVWPHGAPHTYENPTDEVQSILCVDAPPFIPEDEVAVSGEPAVVPSTRPWQPGAR
jgi:dihydroneopterin aldolase